MNKKTKLELSICHILQTKDWIKDVDLWTMCDITNDRDVSEEYNSFYFYAMSMRSIETLFSPNKSVDLTKDSEWEMVTLTEEELLTYYNQRVAAFVNGTTERRAVK